MQPHVPKIFMSGIRVPGGEYEGSLAFPCTCGEPTEIEGDRKLHLVKLASGHLCFIHDGCAVTGGVGE